jgi:broad-specificity NMP kinase
MTRLDPARTTSPGTAARKGRIRILLTGISAVGKSTLVELLRQRGYAAVDLDDGYTTESIGLSGEVLWLEDRVREMLEGPEEVLFVAGCASNQVKFQDEFDHIVLLSAPSEVVRQRLATRDTNPFGKTADEEARVLADQAVVEPMLRRVADTEIVTTAPVERTLDAVLGVCETAMRMRGQRA